MNIHMTFKRIPVVSQELSPRRILTQTVPLIGPSPKGGRISEGPKIRCVPIDPQFVIPKWRLGCG